MDRRFQTRPDITVYRVRFQTSRTYYRRSILRTVDGFPIAGSKPDSTIHPQSRIVENPQPTVKSIDNENLNIQNIPAAKNPQQHLQSVALPNPSSKKSPKSFRFIRGRPLAPMALGGMAILLFSFGVLVAFNTLQTNKTALVQVKALATSTQNNNNDTDTVPNEDKPTTSLSSYSVMPDMPKILKIDKLEVNARIKPVGVNQSNAIKVPASTFDVGWYDKSAKPDKNGTMVLNGHVSGPTQKGVFYRLSTLKPGDKITAVRGDNAQFNYTVTDIKEYDSDKVDMPKVLTTSVAGKKGLNIITCSGKFNAVNNSYTKRVVVFAVQD